MKKILYTFSILLLSTLALPLFAAPKDFNALINDTIIGGLLRPIVPLLIGAAVVVFIYGVLTTMLSEGGDKKEEGKQYMFWGIIGIFVMVSVWGLVAIVQGTFKLDTTVQKVQIIAPSLK
jgi:hypothetical protein